MKFKENLKNLREEKGLTQKQLGELIGKTARTISYYENDQADTGLPDDITLRKLSKALQVSVNELIGKKLTPEETLINKLIDLTRERILRWEQTYSYTTIEYKGSSTKLRDWIKGITDGSVDFDYNYNNSYGASGDLAGSFFLMNYDKSKYVLIVASSTSGYTAINDSYYNNSLGILSETIESIIGSKDHVVINSLLDALEKVEKKAEED